MVASYTTNKVLIKPANGDDVDTWDVPVNSDWDYVDTAFGGNTAINVTGVGAGPTALSDTQYRPPILLFSGVLSNNVNYQIPSGKGGLWVVNNATTGSFSLTISSGGGGTSVVCPQGYIIQVYSDGTNVKQTLTYSVSTTPGGSNTQVQFNSSGAFGGSASFTFDGTVVAAPQFNASGSFRVLGATSGYVGFAAAPICSSVVWTLPSSDGTSGQVLQTDGAGNLSWATSSGGYTFGSSQTFTSSGTFTPPTGVTKVWVTVIGGGGGGGSVGGGFQGGGGGGGSGAAVYRYPVSVTPTVGVTVTVGAAGAAGGAGGTSSFGADVSCTGGGAGGNYSNPNGGAGGTAGSVTVASTTTAALAFPGVAGSAGDNDLGSTGGSGASVNGRTAFSGAAGGTNAAGASASNKGTGGGGGGSSTGVARSGGAGAAGLVIVEW